MYLPYPYIPTIPLCTYHTPIPILYVPTIPLYPYPMYLQRLQYPYTHTLFIPTIPFYTQDISCTVFEFYLFIGFEICYGYTRCVTWLVYYISSWRRVKIMGHKNSKVSIIISVTYMCTRILYSRCTRWYTSYRNPSQPVSTSFSPCGRYIATGSEDRTVSDWPRPLSQWLITVILGVLVWYPTLGTSRKTGL